MRVRVSVASHWRDALVAVITDRTAAKEVRLYQAAPALIARWRGLALALMRERRDIEAPRLRWHVAIDVARGLLYGVALLVLLLSWCGAACRWGPTSPPPAP